MMRPAISTNPRPGDLQASNEVGSPEAKLIDIVGSNLPIVRRLPAAIIAYE
jgi:hypothetical protein